MSDVGSGLNAADSDSVLSRLQSDYGLRENPLEMETPFFPDAQRQHVLESLRHLCAFGDLALLLTGDSGAGKSRILGELVRNESSRLAFHRLPAAALTSVQALARELQGINGHQAADEAPRDLVHSFFRWSEAATARGQRLVLLADNAGEGSVDVLRQLLHGFYGADRSRAAIPVFAGPDELVSALGLEDAGEVHQLHLRPLTRDEMGAYLEPRIQRAGGDLNELLTEHQLTRMHELSRGSFGRLRRVAPAVWLGMASASGSVGGGRWPLPRGLHWPALVLVLLAVSWWLVAQQYDEMVAEQPPEEPERTRTIITLGPDSPDPVVATREGTREVAPEGLSRSSESGERRAPAVTEGLDAVILPQEAAVTERTETARAEPVRVETVDVPAAPESAEPEPEPETGPEPEPQSEPEPEPEPQPGSESEADAGPESDLQADPVAGSDSAGQADDAEAFTPANAARFREAATVRGEGGWIAQYVGGFEEQTALNLLDRLPTIDGLSYTRSQRQGRDWFVVFYGPYESREALESALTEVAEEFAGQDPWIRPADGL